MVSILFSLLLAEGQAPPRFRGEVSAIPSDIENYSFVRGFLKSGEAFVWQSKPQTKYLLWNPKTDLSFAVPPPPEAKFRLAPIVTAGGDLQCIADRADGKVAVFQFRKSVWQQISPPSFHYCDSAYVNATGDLVFNAKSKPNGVFECFITQKGKTTNISQEFNGQRLGALAILDDGRAILSEFNGIDQSTFYFYERGKLSLLGTFRNTPGLNATIHVDSQRSEILVTPVDLAKPLEAYATEIIGPKGKRSYQSPSGKILAQVRHWLNGWYSGYEPSSDPRKQPRSVLVINEASYYIDDLVDNMAELKATRSFQGVFASGSIVSQEGLVISSGPTNLKGGGSAHKHYLLRPIHPQ